MTSAPDHLINPIIYNQFGVQWEVAFACLVSSKPNSSQSSLSPRRLQLLPWWVRHLIICSQVWVPGGTPFRHPFSFLRTPFSRAASSHHKPLQLTSTMEDLFDGSSVPDPVEQPAEEVVPEEALPKEPVSHKLAWNKAIWGSPRRSWPLQAFIY